MGARGRERPGKTRGATPDRPARPGPPAVARAQVNWPLFGAALAVIVAGYILLARGSISLAPIVLVLGYCVLLPLAILVPPRWSFRGE